MAQALDGRFYTRQSDFYRLDGELDAGLVFAAAANEAYQKGQADFSSAAFSDATEACAIVNSALESSDLPADERLYLAAKLDLLRNLLNGVRAPDHRNTPVAA